MIIKMVQSIQLTKIFTLYKYTHNDRLDLLGCLLLCLLLLLGHGSESLLLLFVFLAARLSLERSDVALFSFHFCCCSLFSVFVFAAALAALIAARFSATAAWFPGRTANLIPSDPTHFFSSFSSQCIFSLTSSFITVTCPQKSSLWWSVRCDLLMFDS